MKSVKLLYALAATALLGALYVALNPARPSAEELLTEARDIIDHAPIDELAALRRLESALAMARTAGDADLEARILLTRGELLLEIGAHDTARQDFQRVLDELRPGDAATRRYLVQTSEALGDYERAARELAELVRDEPEYAPAWVESGRLHQRLAEERLAECARELELVLTAGEWREAGARLERLAAMDPQDPARTTVAHELRQMVPEKDEEHLSMALVLVDDASRELRQARADFVRSFRWGLDPAAVAGYLEVLIAADQRERAIELGVIALKRPRIAADARIAALVIRALLDVGDVPRAGELAQQWVRKDEPFEMEFLHLLAEALYAAEDWGGLLRCDGLINRTGSAADRELGQLYRGFGLLGSNQGLPAMVTLRGWLRQDPNEPWPGAMLELWRGIAKAARLARDPLQERHALHEVVKRSPESDGEAWLRLAQLQVGGDHSSKSLALGSLAHAIRLLPGRYEELLAEFEKLGAKALEAEGQTMEFVLQDTHRQSRIIPRGDPNPYVLLSLARMHRAAGNWNATSVLCDRLLEQYPGFPPAVDLRVEALLVSGDLKRAAELAVERLERTGPDDATRELFERLAAYPFSPEQIVRIMRADPEHEGRRRVARYLHEQGDLEGALRCLRETGGAELGRVEQQTLARILIDVGRYEEALETLGQPRAGTLAERRARPLALSAALHVGDQARVEAIARAYAGEPSSEALLPVAAQLLRLGDARRAQQLLARLDQPRTLDGEGLLELGLARLANGDVHGARAELDRAEAFLDPRPVMLARLGVDTAAGDWGAAAQTAVALREELEEDDGSVFNAALCLFAGDAALALELAREGLTADPLSATWTLIAAAGNALWGADEADAGAEAKLVALLGPAGPVQTRLFVRGSELAPRDPRVAAFLVIAVGEPLLAPYAGARLRASAASEQGELWPALLESSLLRTLGESAEARLCLTQLTRRFPSCMPAWREREALERARVHGADHPDLRALREERLEALGRAQPESAEGLLLRAREALDSGLGEAAVALATRAVEARGGWPEAWAVLARARALRGDYAASLEAWRRACLEPAPEAAKPWIPGLIETLEVAERTDPPAIEPKDTLKWLMELAERLPSDPRVALAMAELELRRDPRNPSLGVARAYGRLDAFRREHKNRSLAELQPGAAADWARFHVALDPRMAQQFLEDERLREPGDIELWALLGRVQRQQGDLEGARASLELAARMCASPEVYVELASVLLAQSAPPALVAAALKRASELRGGDEAPLTYDLLALSAYLRRLEPAAWNTAARQLAPIWKTRASSAGGAARALAGWLYLQALLLRDAPGDRAVAREVADAIAPRLRDPYAQSLLEAFRALARDEAAEVEDGAAVVAAD